MESLAGLKTPFRSHGNVTAGNAAGINDGATAALLADEETARELGLPVKMRLVSYSFVGVEPEVMGAGPIPATEKALRQAGLTIDDIEAFEVNEAFAVQVLAFLEHFGIADDDARVNPYGGAIAMGHPLASSGVRLMTQLARQFEERPEVRYGLTTMCIGIGMGGTVIWENPHWTGQTTSRRVTEHRLSIFERAQAIVSDAERVTQAHLRKVTLPAAPTHRPDHPRQRRGPHQAQHLRPARRCSRSTPRSTRRWPTTTIDAIGVTGKPFILAAGADLTSIQGGGPDAVRVVAELGHAVFRKLQDGGKPSFGFVNGLALGGGLEVALHCTYRTVMDSAPALGLPEVMLGLVPGWGGAYLVPNLVGADKAVTLILENPLNQGKTLGGQAAYDLGLADAVFGGPTSSSSRCSGRPPCSAARSPSSAPRSTAARPGTRRSRAPSGIVAVEDRRRLARPPAKAVELIAAARDPDRDEGFAAEDDALDAMSQTAELRAVALRVRPRAEAGQAPRRCARQVAGPPGHQGRHRRRRPDGQPARAAVRTPPRGAGRPHRPRPGARRQGRRLRPRRDRQAARQGPDQPGQGQPPQGAGHRRDRQEDGFADADFVIEAVFEEMSVKKQVFADVEKVVSPECVLATNTSSLSITEMAADLEHPERVVGFHFFNPVAVMPLLEIVKGDADRRRHAGHGVRHRQGAEEDDDPGQGQPVLHRQPAARPLHGRGRPDRRRGHPGRRSPTAPSRASRRCRRSCCSRSSARRSRCTTTRRCTGAFPDRFYVSPALSGSSRRARRPTTAPTAPSTPRSRRCSRSRSRPGRAHRRGGARADARRPRRGGPPDARRGRRRRPEGHRPGDDHRRRVLVLERRADLPARRRGHLREGHRQALPLTSLAQLRRQPAEAARAAEDA